IIRCACVKRWRTFWTAFNDIDDQRSRGCRLVEESKHAAHQTTVARCRPDTFFPGDDLLRLVSAASGRSLLFEDGLVCTARSARSIFPADFSVARWKPNHDETKEQRNGRVRDRPGGRT